MKITVIAAGSRGDIQPYLALAKGLCDAGHQVKLATHENFKAWVESYNIQYATLTGNSQQMIQDGEAQEWVNSGDDPRKFMSGFKRLMGPVMKQAILDTWEASKGADLIVPGSLAYYGAYVVNREMHIPWVQTFLQPIHPTGAFPSPLLPSYHTYGPLRNMLSHYVAGWGTWAMMRSDYNKVLQETLGVRGLPFIGVFGENERKGIPALYGYSPSFLPKPRNWAKHIHVTGYWFLDQSQHWQPPADLLDFLDSGPAPVYVGFGSMSTEDPEATTQMVIDALHKAGQRGILLKGWGAIRDTGQPSDDVFFIDSAPHEWLFPRMEAVVHHGGAGTTGAGLRAGKPSILTPYFADQPWWGMRVYERGVGPRPIPRAELTSDNLATAITEALNGSGMRERAAKLGEQIRAEGGVGTAVRIIESAGGK